MTNWKGLFYSNVRTLLSAAAYGFAVEKIANYVIDKKIQFVYSNMLEEVNHLREKVNKIGNDLVHLQVYRSKLHKHMEKELNILHGRIDFLKHGSAQVKDITPFQPNMYPSL